MNIVSQGCGRVLSVLRVFNFPNLKAEALAKGLAKFMALENRRTGKCNSLKSFVDGEK